MQFKTLGNTQLNISRIGFGCMSLEQKPVSISVLQEAVALGINYFDTADLYDRGLNEELVGRGLKEHRQQVVIATKVGNVWRPDGSGWYWNASKKHIVAAVEESLRRLQTNYIDLYQLHGGTVEDPIDEAIEAFESLVKQGKIRYYGISSIRPSVIREWVSRSNLSSVMLQYSLLDRRPEESVMPLLQQKGIGILVRGSVAQGLLLDKPAKAYLEYTREEVKLVNEIVKSVSNTQRTTAHTAIQYVLQQPGVTAAIVGIRTIKQLEEASLTTDSPSLSIEERMRLQQVVLPKIYKEHR